MQSENQDAAAVQIRLILNIQRLHGVLQGPIWRPANEPPGQNYCARRFVKTVSLIIMFKLGLKRCEDRVKRMTGAERGGSLCLIGAVVASNICGRALDGDQLLDNLGFGFRKFRGHGGEDAL